MSLEYFHASSRSEDVVAALRRDGAAVVREQVGPEVADTVRAVEINVCFFSLAIISKSFV